MLVGNQFLENQCNIALFWPVVPSMFFTNSLLKEINIRVRVVSKVTYCHCSVCVYKCVRNLYKVALFVQIIVSEIKLSS